MNETKEFLTEVQKLDGAKHVANLRFLHRLRPHISEHDEIVDFGAGIGTISLFALSVQSKIRITAIEPIQWCRDQYSKNLESRGFQASFPKTDMQESNVPKGALWVVDMEFLKWDVKRILDSRPSQIWVEGHRYQQRLDIAKEALSEGISLKYSSFLGFPKSVKGGAQFTAAKETMFRKFLHRLAIFRIKAAIFLSASRIEWELNRRVFGLR